VAATGCVNSWRLHNVNNLELCQSLRELAGIRGTGPSTVVGQTGEMLRVVNWIKKSWVDIQNLHKSWTFLINDLAFTTAASKGDYTLADMNASNLRQLDLKSLRCEITSMGFRNRQFMEDWDWDQFRNLYRFNNLTEGRPIRFSVDPKDRSLCLAAIPDATGYTITGRYWSKPIEFTADADVPAIPEQYHMLIVYWALSKYAGYESAPEAKQEALENKARMLSALEADQLPDVEIGSEF